VNFEYEPELLEQLLQDLGQREWRARYENNDEGIPPISEWIEPPHLQIICQRLWESDGRRADRNITRATYERQQGTEGLLKEYFNNVVGNFSTEEKRLASKAFMLLVSRYGTKLARPSTELIDSTFPASLINYFSKRILNYLSDKLQILVDRLQLLFKKVKSRLKFLMSLISRYRTYWPLRSLLDYVEKIKQPLSGYVERIKQQHGKELTKVLDDLDNYRVLRKQSRLDQKSQKHYWYELYHDILAKHVYEWNEGYKRQEFIKHFFVVVGVLGFSLFLVIVSFDAYQNVTQMHFRLSPKRGVSDVIRENWGVLIFVGDRNTVMRRIIRGRILK